jgi:hypothetical protein
MKQTSITKVWAEQLTAFSMGCRWDVDGDHDFGSSACRILGLITVYAQVSGTVRRSWAWLGQDA